MANIITDLQKNPRETLEKGLSKIKYLPLLNRILKIEDTYDLLLRTEKKIEQKGLTSAFVDAFNDFGIKCDIVGAENVPSEKGTIYVSNHPYGIPEGVIALGLFSELIEQRRKEIKVIGAEILKVVRGIEQRVIFVGLHGDSDFSQLREIRKALNEGDLFFYPSADLSGYRLKEAPWKNGFGKIAKHATSIVPIWISGPDHGLMYNLCAKYGLENVRDVFAPREAWNKAGETLTWIIGKPIPKETLNAFSDNNGKLTQYVREKAEELSLDYKAA